MIELAPPTLIAEGSRLQGALTFFSNAQIFGVVEGDVLQQSLETLCVGRTGWVNGTIVSQGPVVVDGRVDGNITCATHIHLSPTATVRGTLTAPTVSIRAGAIFEGDLRAGKRVAHTVKCAA